MEKDSCFSSTKEHGNESTLKYELKLEPCEEATEDSEHMNFTDEDINEFPCPKCESSFNRKSNLKAHVESIHENKWHKCPYCDHISGQPPPSPPWQTHVAHMCRCSVDFHWMLDRCSIDFR